MTTASSRLNTHGSRVQWRTTLVGHAKRSGKLSCPEKEIDWTVGASGIQVIYALRTEAATISRATPQPEHMAKDGTSLLARRAPREKNGFSGLQSLAVAWQHLNGRLGYTIGRIAA